MTRSSSKELITPFEKPERVFRSKRRHFETPGLVESSSPELDLFSDIEEHSEEEETTEIMMETIEKYMSKTRGNYGSGVARPNINDKTHFELKGSNNASSFSHVLNWSRKSLAQEQTIRSFSKGVIPTKTVTDAKVAIKEMAGYSQKWHNGTSSKAKSIETSDRIAAIQAQLNNLRREIKKVNEKVYAT
ncbi:hypothetical protein Tco_1350183 [Tanacetum coccineum]